jgi:hypothetical protein
MPLGHAAAEQCLSLALNRSYPIETLAIDDLTPAGLPRSGST